MSSENTFYQSDDFTCLVLHFEIFTFLKALKLFCPPNLLTLYLSLVSSQNQSDFSYFLLFTFTKSNKKQTKNITQEKKRF